MIFFTLWRKKYIIHDELLIYNHTRMAKIPSLNGYLNALKYTSYLRFDRMDVNTFLDTPIKILDWYGDYKSELVVKTITTMGVGYTINYPNFSNCQY